MKEEKKDNGAKQAFIMVSQVGISMISPVLICGILGYYMDKSFHTSFWFIIMILLGIMAAFRNVYLMLRRFYKKDLAEEKRRLEYEQGLLEHSRLHGKENIDDLKARRIRKRD